MITRPGPDDRSNETQTAGRPEGLQLRDPAFLRGSVRPTARRQRDQGYPSREYACLGCTAYRRTVPDRRLFAQPIPFVKYSNRAKYRADLAAWRAATSGHFISS